MPKNPLPLAPAAGREGGKCLKAPWRRQRWRGEGGRQKKKGKKEREKIKSCNLYKKKLKKKKSRNLFICIGPTIRIGREGWCLPYAGFVKGHPPTGDLRYGDEDSISPSTLIFSCYKGLTLYIWVEPARKGKGRKIGNFTLSYWVLWTTYIFFALLEIVMCLMHIEASHIMAFNS